VTYADTITLGGEFNDYKAAVDEEGNLVGLADEGGQRVNLAGEGVLVTNGQVYLWDAEAGKFEMVEGEQAVATELGVVILSETGEALEVISKSGERVAVEDGAWVEYNREGMSQFVDEKRRYNGMLEIDEEVGKIWFKEFVETGLFQSRVNNHYFYENFGIQLPQGLWKEGEEEAEIPQEVIDSFWEKLKERGYVMPPGLIWIGGYPRFNNFCVKLVELPEFRLDTVVTEVLDQETFSRERYYEGKIKGSDTFSRTSLGATTYVIGLVEDEQGTKRLRLG
jgi:hypothetical protein